MLKTFQKLSKIKQKFLLLVGFVLSCIVGALLGVFVGLVVVTFIPICCNEAGCHNCFEFNGMIGYQATAYIGFWLGLFVVPFLYILFIIQLIKKNILKLK